MVIDNFIINLFLFISGDVNVLSPKETVAILNRKRFHFVTKPTHTKTDFRRCACVLFPSMSYIHKINLNSLNREYIVFSWNVYTESLDQYVVENAACIWTIKCDPTTTKELHNKEWPISRLWVLTIYSWF